MKFKTIFTVLLLLSFVTLTNCASQGPGKTPATVEEAQKLYEKEKKKKKKIASKEKKAADKRYWNLQSKEAKKSIRKNRRRQKKLARQQNR